MKISKESWAVIGLCTLFSAIAVAGVLTIRDNMDNGFKLKA